VATAGVTSITGKWGRGNSAWQWIHRL